MPWYNFWKKEPVDAKPEQGIWVSGVRDDYAINESIKKLTPEKLARAMRNAEAGDTSEQYEVFDIVEQDPHVTSVLGRRRRSVTGKEFKISPAVENNTNAQKAADLCNELIFGVDGNDGVVENWDQALFDLSDAIGKGFALSQIAWEFDAGRWLPRKLINWPQRECVLGNPMTIGQYLQDHDEIRIITDKNLVSGEDLQPNSWITHIQKSWSVPLARAGLFRSITWFYLFKHFGAKDWAMFLERYGLPFRVGKYPPGSSDTEKAALKAAVMALGKDAACILPQMSTIELLETKMTSSGSNTTPHPAMVDFCNSEISKAIFGNTMTADQGDRGARSAKESYQADESEIIEGDCKNLAGSIRRDFLKPIVKLNLGDAYPVPKCEFISEDNEDLLQRAQRDKIIAKDIGLKVPVSYFYQKYDLPEPQDGEEVLGGVVVPPKPLMPPKQGDNQPPDDDNQDDSQDNSAAPNASQIAQEIISLAAEKKKSVDWVISMMLSREQQKER